MLRERIELKPYLILMPALLLMILLYAYPIALTLVQSFQEVVLFGGESKFINFQNYIALIRDSNFYRNLSITLKYSSITILLKMVGGFAIALLLHSDIYGKKYLRFGMLIPWAIPQVAVAVVWRWIYSGSYGYLNEILKQFHLIKDNIAWLADMKVTLYAAAFVDAWMGWPLVAMMLLSGLEAIPKDLYQASRIDGANSWYQFIHVTLSEMRGVFLLTLTLVSIWSFNAFSVIYVLTQGGPLRTTENLMMRVYNESFKNFNFGVSSALSVIIMLLLGLFTAVYIRLLMKED